MQPAGSGSPARLLTGPSQDFSRSPRCSGRSSAQTETVTHPARPPLPPGGVRWLSPGGSHQQAGRLGDTRARVCAAPSSQAERTSHQNLQSLTDGLLTGAIRCPEGSRPHNPVPPGIRPPTPGVLRGAGTPTPVPPGEQPPPTQCPEGSRRLQPSAQTKASSTPSHWSDIPGTHFTTPHPHPGSLWSGAPTEGSQLTNRPERNRRKSYKKNPGCGLKK